jgi:hypothetical protein
LQLTYSVHPAVGSSNKFLSLEGRCDLKSKQDEMH